MSLIIINPKKCYIRQNTLKVINTFPNLKETGGNPQVLKMKSYSRKLMKGSLQDFGLDIGLWAPQEK